MYTQALNSSDGRRTARENRKTSEDATRAAQFQAPPSMSTSASNPMTGWPAGLPQDAGRGQILANTPHCPKIVGQCSPKAKLDYARGAARTAAPQGGAALAKGAGRMAATGLYL